MTDSKQKDLERRVDLENATDKDQEGKEYCDCEDCCGYGSDSGYITNKSGTAIYDGVVGWISRPNVYKLVP